MGVSRSTGKRNGRQNAKDIAGQRFGRLVAIRPTEKRGSSREVIWECLCDCGNTTFTEAGNLLCGKTQSCGCLKMERIKASRYKDTFREKQRIKSTENWEDAAMAIGMQDNTNVSLAKSKKARCDSSTGKRGVFKKRNSYFVVLQFQKKVYTEYGFKTVEDAEKARERMWEKYVMPYLESVGRLN